MKTCYLCGGDTKEDVYLIFHNGKNTPQKVQKCTKCGKAMTSIDEYERVRKEIFNKVSLTNNLNLFL